MLTSRGHEEHVLEGFEAGVDDYISKPFRSSELLARIKRHIGAD
jgi:DNA-binding response OmpR family regulator